jgi:hypothetical protein
MLVHGLQQVERACDVVVVVQQRLLGAFTNRFQPSEVNNSVDAMLKTCAQNERCWVTMATAITCLVKDGINVRFVE